MCAVEYGWLVKELQALVGKRLSKISKLENAYRFHIGDADMVCQPPARMHVTKYIEESEDADGFVEKARKEIKGMRLEGAGQVNNDRILMLDFGECKLYFEMFAKGNLVLVKEGKTIAALRHEQWAGREIKPGREYGTPKPPATKLKDVISDKYIIVSLLRLPIGKEYAEELLARAGINEKTPGKSLSEKQTGKLESELGKMMGEFSPHAFYEDGKAAAFGLIKFSKYSKLEARDFKTLSEAADEYYFANPMPAEEAGEMERLEARLAKQEEYLGQLRNEEKELKERGDFIYANYEEIEKIIKTASNCKPGEMEEKLSGYNAKYDKKEKKIEIEIQ
ncbi:NFACT family protein [Candidatus Micrarchaeota archaeon]|nr:NFACT family protein [Candidatus Micrarchaeota archaeon]